MKEAMLTSILQYEVVTLLSCGRTDVAITWFQLLGTRKHVSWVSTNEKREKAIRVLQAPIRAIKEKTEDMRDLSESLVKGS